MVDEARPPRGDTRVDPGGGATEATRPAIHVMQPNPAMDRIQPVASFVLGAVNRSDDVRVVPGGKGLNAARGLRDLGIPVAAYGFAGGFVGAYLRAACASLGIVDRHTAVDGESRICQIIVERDSGRSTVLNEPGPRVTRDDGRRLLASVTRQCRQGDVVVITGGTPPGLPEDFYARAVEAIQRRGARAVVDTAGVQLRHALRCAPWIVKTNTDEYVNASEGESPRTEGELVAAMRRQVARGSWAVILPKARRVRIAVTGVEMADRGTRRADRQCDGIGGPVPCRTGCRPHGGRSPPGCPEARGRLCRGQRHDPRALGTARPSTPPADG